MGRRYRSSYCDGDPPTGLGNLLNKPQSVAANYDKGHHRSTPSSYNIDTGYTNCNFRTSKGGGYGNERPSLSTDDSLSRPLENIKDNFQSRHVKMIEVGTFESEELVELEGNDDDNSHIEKGLIETFMTGFNARESSSSKEKSEGDNGTKLLTEGIDNLFMSADKMSFENYFAIPENLTTFIATTLANKTTMHAFIHQDLTSSSIRRAKEQSNDDVFLGDSTSRYSPQRVALRHMR
ncbi:hypothetical protein BJ878DRAFT_478823 [Calycina marina]|uniref:Uncharacterized protein n=1 Tax=Calycina marina TaxID=1763456 RepID=A0A9P7Z5U4_9HELO|nr:hypothetical protein BJ878DRAFT_478823 [Calycina marina]